MRTRCPSRRVRARLFFLFCSGLVAPATQAAIVVNGRLDEPEWRDAVQYRDLRVVAPYLLSPAPDSAGTVGYLLSTPDGLVVGSGNAMRSCPWKPLATALALSWAC